MIARYREGDEPANADNGGFNRIAGFRGPDVDRCLD
jgi:hypothetical protein